MVISTRCNFIVIIIILFYLSCWRYGPQWPVPKSTLWASLLFIISSRLFEVQSGRYSYDYNSFFFFCDKCSLFLGYKFEIYNILRSYFMKDRPSYELHVALEKREAEKNQARIGFEPCLTSAILVQCSVLRLSQVGFLIAHAMNSFV